MHAESSEIRTSNRQTHGLTVMKRAISTLGSRTIDRRSRVGKSLSQWRADLVSDLGGQDQISTQENAVIDLCVREKLLLDSLDAWLLEQRSLVNLRKKSVIPALSQRAQLADSLARHLQMLGLRCRAKPVRGLAELLRAHNNPPQEGQQHGDSHSGA